MDIVLEKVILKNWINSIDDPKVIAKIMEIKEKQDLDFEKEWERSIPGEELKRRTKIFIETLPWEK